MGYHTHHYTPTRPQRPLLRMLKNMTSQTGTLYVVATPIGNLEDITLRAIRVLGEVDVIAAEDTRHTRKLLSHLGISKPMLSYYKDKEVSRGEQIFDHLRNGENCGRVGAPESR